MLSFDEGMDQLSILTELYNFNCSAVAVAETQFRASFMYDATGDKEYVAEGFSDMIATIVDAIKRLIKSITDFFKNVFRTLMSMGMDYKEFVKNYKDDLLDATPDFTHSGYTYEGIWKDEPDMTEFEMAIEQYNHVIDNPEKQNFKDAISSIRKYLDVDHMNHIRAKILGEKGSIEDSEYTDRVREFYRGSSKEESIHVDKSYINKLVSDVDQVYKLKDKAEKDRNKIIALLSRTETFFSKKADIVYKGNVRTINTRRVDYDKEKQSVKFDDTPIDYSSDMSTLVTKLINSMYTQVRQLSAIINICVCERAIAFRDYIKQCRKILGLAVKSKKDDDIAAKEKQELAAEGFVVLDGTALEEATNYVDLWEQGKLSLQSKEVIEEINFQYHVAQHAVACFESGFITEPVMEGILGDAINAIKNFFTNLIGLFKKKQVENIEKYEPWYTDSTVIEAVSNNAMSKEFTVLPLWDGVWGRKIDLVIADMLKGISDFSKGTDVYVWAKPILGYDSAEEYSNDKDVEKKVLNYFRVGKPVSFIKSEKIGGAKLKTKVSDMFRYMGEYETEYRAMDGVKRKLDMLKEPPESIVAESVLVESLGYLDMAGVLLMEATTPASSGTSTPSGQAAEINRTGNKEAQQAATDVREENKQENNAGKEEIKKPSSDKDSKVEYYKKGLAFTQSALQACCTSLEERYTLYWKILSSTAPDDVKPIFKDGVYQGTKKTGLIQKMKDKRNEKAEKKGKKDQDATKLVQSK